MFPPIELKRNSLMTLRIQNWAQNVFQALADGKERVKYLDLNFRTTYFSYLVHAMASYLNFLRLNFMSGSFHKLVEDKMKCRILDFCLQPGCNIFYHNVLEEQLHNLNKMKNTTLSKEYLLNSKVSNQGSWDLRDDLPRERKRHTEVNSAFVFSLLRNLPIICTGSGGWVECNGLGLATISVGWEYGDQSFELPSNLRFEGPRFKRSELKFLCVISSSYICQFLNRACLSWHTKKSNGKQHLGDQNAEQSYQLSHVNIGRSSDKYSWISTETPKKLCSRKHSNCILGVKANKK